MKLVKIKLFMVLVAGIITLSSLLLFVNDVHSQSDDNILLDAVAALEQSHSDLADRLLKYAKEESMQLVEWRDVKMEDKTKELARQKNGLQLLKDAIAALQDSRPDLVDPLTKYLDKKTKEIDLSE